MQKTEITHECSIADEVTQFLRLHPNVRWVDAMIPDINGILRGKRLDLDCIKRAYACGLSLPSSVYICDTLGNSVVSTGVGTADGAPDCTFLPVPGTLALAPWLGEEHAQVLLTMIDGEGGGHWLDVRRLVGRMNDYIRKLGYRVVVAVELEFYLVEPPSDQCAAPLPAAAPLTGVRPTDTQFLLMDGCDDYAPVLTDILETCSLQGIPVYSAMAEGAPAQFEINLHHSDDPVAACDHAILMKRAIKGAAKRVGMLATFMSRPLDRNPGSATHIHLSLVDEQGRNVFDNRTAAGIQLMRTAVGGLLETIIEGTAIFAPNVNWFRRPHEWWPRTPTWGYNNRRASVRIPCAQEGAWRLEHRPAGADANPYLVMAAILAGVHHGLTNVIDPGAPKVGDEASKVPVTLPITWVDALRAFDKAEILPVYFESRWWELYSKVKWSEFHEFNEHVSNLEYQRFLRLV
jgi:glutamine synthetase